jgi:hypothetical protein
MADNQVVVAVPEPIAKQATGYLTAGRQLIVLRH